MVEVVTCEVVIDMDGLLLLGMWRGQAGGTAGVSAGQREKGGGGLLSSYSSNNNNPRCGTDPLRDAW